MNMDMEYNKPLKTGPYRYKYDPPVHLDLIDAFHLIDYFQSFRGYRALDLTKAHSLKKIDDRDGSYNCHAWSVGYKYYIQPNGRTYIDFDLFYAQYGFEVTESEDNASIAVYGENEGKLDHAAVKLIVDNNEVWTSKLGPGCILIHKKLSSLEGEGNYGRVLRLYKKIDPFITYLRETHTRRTMQFFK